ncbi:hypothetical protein KSS87_016565 [Heliosperma pusillum]|nr:hypothetical protein KSS87_016565 [Heliosperma pusillum]
MAYQVILAAIGDLFREDDCPEMDELLGEAVLECRVPSLNSVGILKDKENLFFKMGNVPLAYFHYKIPLKFLLLMGPLAICDAPSATSLALSLFLNLAAYDLKVSDYEQVCWYCNLILYVEPSNIKALYRRGLALKHLNLLPKAVADFECALKFNPTNKSIFRELQVVEPPKFDPLGIERKGKKPLLSPASFDDCVPVNLPEVPMDLESSQACDAAVNEAVCLASLKSSHFTFSIKKKPYNKLNLSSEDYDNLIHGKVLGFYHPTSISFMRARPLISKTIQRGTPWKIFQASASPSHLLLPTNRKLGGDDTLYCESWRFTVETNDCQPWNTVPYRCLDFVKSYMIGDRYVSDSTLVANNALLFANSINVSNDGLDAWVFDIDETLLSGLPYYALHGFGSEAFNEETFYEWCSLADAPAVPASLKLYKEIQQLGFTIFILTGRDEPVRNSTEAGLLNAGFSNWKRLILREPSDKGVPPTIYKSGKRKELVAEGYRIRGNSGDQWSDLLGFAVAERSFKLPNLLYYLP